MINKTALDGLYAIETEGWLPMRLPPPPVGNVPNPAARPSGAGDMTDPARPTLFNVLQKLGLVWDVKRVKLSEIKQGVVAAPNGRLITPIAEESWATSGD